jgi:hypothetical protein
MMINGVRRSRASIRTLFSSSSFPPFLFFPFHNILHVYGSLTNDVTGFKQNIPAPHHNPLPVFREGEERLNFYYVLQGSLDAKVSSSNPEASQITTAFFSSRVYSIKILLLYSFDQNNDACSRIISPLLKVRAVIKIYERAITLPEH